MRFFILFILLFLPISLFAQSVDILWQGEGYTPPFYEGKSLWAKQSFITFVAVPQGLGSSASLNYKWIRNGTVLGSLSGVGKNSLVLKDAVFSKPFDITMEIVDNNDETLAESSITVQARDPLLLIYEDNPLYGYMFHREVGTSHNLDKGEVTFAAFPLFNSPAARESSELSYRWRTNAGDTWEGSSVTYRAPEEAGGVANVNLSFGNSSKIMRAIERNFLIQFGRND